MTHIIDLLAAGFRPEPETARAILAKVQTRSLAALIAGLINDHEPLLRAETDGATVTVRERGNGVTMTFTIEQRK